MTKEQLAQHSSHQGLLCHVILGYL